MRVGALAVPIEVAASGPRLAVGPGALATSVSLVGLRRRRALRGRPVHFPVGFVVAQHPLAALLFRRRGCMAGNLVLGFGPLPRPRHGPPQLLLPLHGPRESHRPSAEPELDLRFGSRRFGLPVSRCRPHGLHGAHGRVSPPYGAPRVPCAVRHPDCPAEPGQPPLEIHPRRRRLVGFGREAEESDPIGLVIDREDRGPIRRRRRQGEGRGDGARQADVHGVALEGEVRGQHAEGCPRVLKDDLVPATAEVRDAARRAGWAPGRGVGKEQGSEV
ncbi:hypothetical protein DFJ74DRAFT_689786 [Hyaloraphidium curvatum]|nr:hypothetical protein DFJ74DRAFT_689786 [Hyaloraphidium curvatum]